MRQVRCGFDKLAVELLHRQLSPQANNRRTVIRALMFCYRIAREPGVRRFPFRLAAARQPLHHGASAEITGFPDT